MNSIRPEVLADRACQWRNPDSQIPAWEAQQVRFFSDSRKFVCIRGQKVLNTNHAHDAVSLQPKSKRAEC